MFTRLTGTRVKDAALFALDQAKPRWHLVDAKDKVWHGIHLWMAPLQSW